MTLEAVTAQVESTCIEVAISTGYLRGLEIIESGLGQSRLAGSLSRRLFIASVVITVECAETVLRSQMRLNICIANDNSAFMVIVLYLCIVECAIRLRGYMHIGTQYPYEHLTLPAQLVQ